MAKIRGVKPEFWTADGILEMSIPARLLFIGLWNYACDNGHLPDKPRQIKMRLMPADDVKVPELLDEMVDAEQIVRQDGWITIPDLTTHQKPHKRWWATCEKPGCEVPNGASHAPTNRGATVAKPVPTVEPPVGNRGATADGDGEGDGEGERKTPGALTRTEQPTSRLAIIAGSSQRLVGEWIDHCPEPPPGRVKGQIAKEIKTMLDEGIPYERVRSGLAEWNTRGLHPSVLPSVVHELGNRKNGVSRRQAETNGVFDRAMERARAKEAGQ